MLGIHSPSHSAKFLVFPIVKIHWACINMGKFGLKNHRIDFFIQVLKVNSKEICFIFTKHGKSSLNLLRQILRGITKPVEKYCTTTPKMYQSLYRFL